MYMRKQTTIQIILIIVLSILLIVLVFNAINAGGRTSKKIDNNILYVDKNNSIQDSANKDKPEKPPEGKDVNNSSKIDVSGDLEISNSSKTLNNQDIKTISDLKNAILIKESGELTLNDSTISKTGDTDNEGADFYGANAAILVNDKGKLNLNNSEIRTDGSHANAVFVYGSGIAKIKNTYINTKKNNSGGIMVAGGGTLYAENLTITTDGNSSAAIRSDRGGGIMMVTGGVYTSNGVGSPAIYSTANTTVEEAKLISTKSEGIVVEGKNSVTLKYVSLTDTNTTLNGNSETYKNIFLYQSMSGDASQGTSEFVAENSNILTNNGDTIFVTNTNALIRLTNNIITNYNGDFLRIQAGKWGNDGSNGGDVILALIDQNISGGIIVDDISTLEMTLDDASYYEGAINSDNTAKSIKLDIKDKTSKIKLTADSYITSLENKDASNSNIDFNGYKLYVNGIAINE